jgi:ribulose-phosphate 3-epimerase
MADLRPQKIEIIPAVLPQSFKDLEEHLAPLKDVIKLAQVDVVDGQYAKGKTWPYRDTATFEKIAKEERGLPFWDKIDFQFDLMIEHPDLVLKEYLDAGASHVVLHVKSSGAQKALQIIVDMRTEEIGSFSVHGGIALGPSDQPDVLLPFEAQFDFVQVMGIDREGKQGEPFDKRALYLVERLRARYPKLPIQVDGGVSLQNARELVAAGATGLVVGSAIVKAEDPLAAYQEFVELVNQ